NTFISDPITTTDGVDPITAYLGTYGTYSTFSSSLVSYLGGSTNYAAQLATLINKETADAQVKADKELKDLDLSGIAKAYTESTTVTLPTQAQYFDGVTISWAVKSGASVASISGSTLTLTPGSSAVDVTLTVTVSVGGKTATKDVTFKVESMVYLTVNTTPVVNTAYTLYVVHADLNKTLYATGEMSGNYLATTEAIGEAAAFYVTDAGEGKFYLNFNNEKYLNVTTYTNKSNKQAPSIALGDTAITKWNWNSEYNTFVSDEVAEITSTSTKTVYIGAYGTYTTMSFSSTSYLGEEGNFNTRLLKAVKTSEITEADKIAQEVAMFAPTFETDFTEDGEITVPVAGTTFTDVAITWTSNNTAVAAVNGNKVTITRGNEAAEVTLTATFSCGTATVQTYTVTLNVAAKVIPELTITEAVTKGLDDTDEAKYYVCGTVVEVYNAKYGNVYIADDAGNEIYVYGTLDSEGNQGQDMADPLQVGDKVKLLSICTQYKGSAQLSNAVVVENTTPATHSDAVKALIEGRKISTTTTIEENTNVTVPVAGTTFTDVTITWVSNNTTAAAVSDNKIVYTLGEEAQTVTLTATVKSGSFEKAYTFTVAVAAKLAEGALTSTVTFSQSGYENGAAVSEFAIGEHITVTTDGGGNSNTVKYYGTGTAIRMYPQNSLTFKAATGYKIKSIELTTGSGDYAIVQANCEVTNGTATVNGTTATITATATGDITLKHITATKGHWRITAIKVIYEAV
ncbi:MAG: hypothetical protein J6A63_01510, partial [Clostridia bacterium]|nr:hypothetical protein [Clostridia bacterium]